MSTLRINNIEAQSIPASPTIDEKVKVTNSSGDILVNIDGKTSGITTIGINTTDGNIKFDANSNVLITGILTATTLSGNFTPTSLEIGSNIKLGNAGVITATSFVGSGANLTSLPAQATIANNADNRIITGGSGVNLNAESNVLYDGTNFGIGKSPSRTLDVQGKIRSSDSVCFGDNSSTPSEGAAIHRPAASSLAFVTNNTEKLRIDSAGNMGLGITPDTQGNTVDSLQIGSATNLYNETSDDYTILGNNVYFDGTNNKYIKTQESSRLMQNAGEFTFQQAASGSADANITYTTPLKIASDGQITQTAASGDTVITLKRSNTNTVGTVGGINFAALDGHSVASIQARGDGDNEGANLQFYTTTAAAGDMFNAANVERLRIDSSGRTLINTTAVTNTNDQLTVKRPASGFGEMSMTVDANTSSNSAANAFIFTKSKHTYWNGYGFQSSHGHIGAIVGMRDSTGMNTSHKIRIEIGGTGINASEEKTWDFLNTGDLSISDGNLVVASGHGIDFSATGGGSNTSNESELFDDYEEGSCAVLIHDAAGSNISVTNNTFKYTKIGNRVFIAGSFVFAETGSKNGGLMILYQLPFVPAQNLQATGTYWYDGTSDGADVTGVIYVSTNSSGQGYLKQSTTIGQPSNNKYLTFNEIQKNSSRPLYASFSYNVS